MAYDLWNDVKLKEEQQYDGKTVLTTSDIGEVVDIIKDEEGTRYVVAFQELQDEEGVTPMVFAYADQLKYAY